jgi:putative CocE/NonD family hydrolase
MFQTGSNEWKAYEEWPPVSTTTETALYFREDGSLSFEPPPSGPPSAPYPSDGAPAPFDEYISDPANPVPYSERPIMGFWQGLSGSTVPRFQRAGRLWKVEDQRFATGRPDVLTWMTPPLEQDVEITGDIVAHLFASTTGTDSDWVVKLIDVYPEDYAEEPEMGGYQLMVADDVLRGKFRNGYENPEPLEPGQIYEFEVPLWARNHMFRAGHRIMVQVQSTWFPLIGRNPQTFTDIPTATEEDYQAATQRVFRTARYPSHVKVWVAGGGG